ncbi:arginyl-tRNA synthetase [Plasmodium vivax Mauritania I]|uniref:Arginyl-tRNA synthetase n=1 Tax=Plasmodium vivax Mauritania I TaxID=1035515 RepID=A0A0J9TEN9_PLAVI|nr:arginyl-tRNA synthetase [Plasmodium vivax Mauritania I]
MIRAALLLLLFQSGLRCFQVRRASTNHEHLGNVFFPSVRGRPAYVGGLPPLRWSPPKGAANKAQTKRCRGDPPGGEVHTTGEEVHSVRDDLHAALNKQLQNVAKQILRDENVKLPKHCLLEENKLFDQYEYQSSVILFLEHSLGKGNDVRSEILRILRGTCADLIDSLHLSPNGILNIRVADAFVVREFLQFYRAGGAHMGRAAVEGGTNNNFQKMETPQSGDRHTVLLDFCGVNMAKNMHMGHLKSLLLGNALSNIFRSLNYSVKCRSHIGDWNMNMAMVLSFFVMFPREVLSRGKLNEREVPSICGAAKHEKENSCEGSTSPCVVSGQMNRHTHVEHPVAADSTQPGVNEAPQNLLDEELLMNMLSSLREENFDEGYQQLDPSKWEDTNLHNIEFAYKMGKKLFTSSDVFKRISKRSLRMMYQRDEKMIALWGNICRRSKRANKEILDKLQIRRLIDKGESFYVKFVPTVLRRLEDANAVFQLGGKSCLLLRSRGGAVSSNPVSSNPDGSNPVSGNLVSGCTPSGRKDTHILSSYEDHYDVMQATHELREQARRNDADQLKKNFTLLTLQNDVAFTYAAIDLAAIHYRVTHEKANKIIYVVDENQRKHFMQIFAIAKFAHILPDQVECVCLNYGFVLNSENRKMKTKDLCKKNVSVKEMLESVKLANLGGHTGEKHTGEKHTGEKHTGEKHTGEKHRESFLLSSLIYSYLAVKNYKRQVIGNILNNFHAEYLLIINCYNEVSSILGKAKKGDYSSLLEKRKNIQIEKNLKKLMLHMMRFNNITEEVTRSYSVDRLCSFLFTLSQKMQPLLQSSSVHNFLSALNGLLGKKEQAEEQVNGVAGDKGEVTHVIREVTQTELFLLLKNSGLLDLREDESLPEQSGKIETLIFNRILEVLIMQAYLSLVGRTFGMLNLQLVNFGRRGRAPGAARL